MQHLILVKHSMPEVDPAVPAHQWTLSAEGRRRCDSLAVALMAYHPAAVVCSAEPKAGATAALVAARLGLGYEVAAGLHEQERRTSKYLPTAEFEATMEQLFAQPRNLVFGEETARQAQDRFSSAVESVMARYPKETVIIVAHGTVIALFAARHTGIDPFPLWRRLGLPSFAAFEVPEYRLVAILDAVVAP
jgi:broad specificity phosphatase PhoE